MNSEIQVIPQQENMGNTDERIIRRPPLFWRPYFVNPFLAGLMGGVLGGLLVSTLVGPYRYVYWYPFYPVYLIY